MKSLAWVLWLGLGCLLSGGCGNSAKTSGSNQAEAEGDSAELARPVDVANPLASAKVGDWAVYRTTGSTEEGITTEGRLEITVTARTKKEVTLKIVAITKSLVFRGSKKEGSLKKAAPTVKEVKIDLTKPYAGIAGMFNRDNGARVEKGESGKEKVTVGGKEYECEFQKAKRTATGPKEGDVSDVTVWTSKSVPVLGMVKMELKSNLGGKTLERKMELSGAGRK